MKKSKIFIAVILVLCLVLALTLVACDSSGGDSLLPPVQCEHEWGEWEISLPQCTQEGEKVRQCLKCSQKETIKIPAEGHKVKHQDKIEATCEKEGIKECYVCEKCNKYFEDEEASKELSSEDVKIDLLAHNLQKHEKVEATCEADGKKEYWSCSECKKMFSDSEGKNKIDNIVTPAKGHSLDNNHFCTVCHTSLATDGLEYELSGDGTYYIVKGIGYAEETELYIPRIYEGKPVKIIKEHAFYYCSSLTSIRIPDSVTSIERDAFSGCSSLLEVYNLSSLDIVAGSSAYGEVGYYAKVIHTSSDEPSQYIKTSDGYLFFNDIANNKYYLVAYDGTEIDLVLPKDINGNNYKINDGAFSGCKSLTSITIPNNVTRIDDGAFSGCKSLTSITIPDSVTSIGDGVFAWCSNLTNITIPDSVTSIGSHAFYGCSSLTSITIPDGVTSINYGTFFWCGLTSITIPDGVTCIDTDAFYGCNSLISVTIPDSVTSIGSHAFMRCYSLTSITIPSNVTCIDTFAFRECYKLLEIYNLSSLDIVAGSSDYGEVGYYAKVIHTSLDQPSQLTRTSDGYWFFNDIVNNKYYLVAYEGTETDLVLPKDINGNNYENRYAFYGCDSLTSIIIPDSVTSIGDYAFMYCKSLTSVTIGNGVTSIGDSAFFGCSSLTEVYYKGNEVDWNKIEINDDNDDLTSATRYYYSETKPTAEGNYWYYGADEKTPVKW